MVEISTEIRGIKELARDIDKLSASFGRTTLRTALRNGGKPVVKTAKAHVAVDEGDLKRALIGKAKVDRKGEGQVRIGARRGGKFKGYHAHFIELGTSKQPAQPYLRPALDENERVILSEFVDAINRTIAGKLKQLGIETTREEDVEG